MSERWGDSAADRAALDRWITREPDDYCACDLRGCCEGDECCGKCDERDEGPEPEMPEMDEDAYYKAGEDSLE